jgi:16S rRNA (uracil1498-N3)-methyltransferase
MGRRRFFAPENNFDLKSSKVLLTNDEARHLRDALRLKVGDEVFVFDGEGKEFRCSIAKSLRDTAELDIIEEVSPASQESTLDLTLGVALLKGDKFDLVVQKTTELGVQRIVPLVTRHADIHLRDSSDADKRVIRWQRIALEAAKQSGRALVPRIDAPVSFSTFITDRSSAGILFSERRGQSLSEAVQAYDQPAELTAIVGSEGGWSDEELDAAHDAGCQIVTLSGRILRAETAAITVATLLQHQFGDLK